ncbi:MAG: hypothetical protein IPM80_20575 [Proteobacteria bacterium]|nr:hypothetical protein [Pseudomonadota bacterium]
MTVVAGLVVGIAPTAGLVLGGYLTESYSWHALVPHQPGAGRRDHPFVAHWVDVDKPDWSLLKRIDFCQAYCAWWCFSAARSSCLMHGAHARVREP